MKSKIARIYEFSDDEILAMVNIENAIEEILSDMDDDDFSGFVKIGSKKVYPKESLIALKDALASCRFQKTIISC